MSADNGVYIAKFPDGFRVTHAQAIENIDFYPKGSVKRKDTLRSYFGKSKTYPTLEDAYVQAHKLEAEVLNDDFCPILEYGVCFMGEYESFKIVKTKKKKEKEIMKFYITEAIEKEVDRKTYIKFEREAGFYPKQSGDIACASFSSGKIQGRVVYEREVL